MRNCNFCEDKIVINCIHCMSKLRVPADKGKISVVCPACGKEFIFNPNSILHTLKQAIIYSMSFLKRSKRSWIVLLAVILVILLAVLLVFSGKIGRENIDEKLDSNKYSIIRLLYCDTV